jgi:hypothetical protein
MAEKTETEKTDLEKALDESLGALQKAASGKELSKSEEKEEVKGEAPNKGASGKGDGDEEKAKKTASAEKEDMKGEAKKDEDDDVKGEKDEEEAMKAGCEKSVTDSLTKSEEAKNAVEVSKFLRDFVKSIGEIVGGLKNENLKMRRQIASLGDALAKSQAAQNDLIKSMNADLQTIGGRPLPRKSVPVASIEKSMRGNEGSEGKMELSKSQVAQKLCEMEIAGKIPNGTTSKYEMTGELHKSLEGLVFGESK